MDENIKDSIKMDCIKSFFKNQFFYFVYGISNFQTLYLNIAAIPPNAFRS